MTNSPNFHILIDFTNLIIQKQHILLAKGFTSILIGLLLLNFYWRKYLTRDLLLTKYNNYDEHEKMNQVYSNKFPKSNKTRILRWRQDRILEAINNQRIILHETSGSGKLNAKQSCAAESTAKNNPDREIQIFIRESKQSTTGNKHIVSTNSPWLKVLKHYSNSEVIFYDEFQYFNNTRLTNWLLKGKWRESFHGNAHFSSYVSLLSLLRGGGLLIDLDAIITLKRLPPWDWWNFFVKNGRFDEHKLRPKYQISSEVMHLIYGHRLGEELILNLSEEVYDPHASPHEYSSRAIETSIYHICHTLNGIKSCPDVHFLNYEEIFLPRLDSSFWQKTRFDLKNLNNNFMNNQTADSVVRFAINSHDAPFITWNSMVLEMKNEESTFNMIYNTILDLNCPITVANFPKKELF
jgi:hypothetical protein